MSPTVSTLTWKTLTTAVTITSATSVDSDATRLISRNTAHTATVAAATATVGPSHDPRWASELMSLPTVLLPDGL